MNFTGFLFAPVHVRCGKFASDHEGTYDVKRACKNSLIQDYKNVLYATRRNHLRCAKAIHTHRQSSHGFR